MRSSRGRISNSPQKLARNCSTTSRNYSTTATGGRPKSPKTWRLTPPIDDANGLCHRPAPPMILQAIMFYLFAAAAVAAGAMVVVARNPVHSVLFLILAFFNTAGLFVLIGAEFL